MRSGTDREFRTDGPATAKTRGLQRTDSNREETRDGQRARERKRKTETTNVIVRDELRDVGDGVSVSST